MNYDPFQEYLLQADPNKRDKAYAWHTAIGLQAVDGLKPSKYLIDIAIQNIEGNISFEQAQQLIDLYYEENPLHNRATHISGLCENSQDVNIRSQKANIGTKCEHCCFTNLLINAVSGQGKEKYRFSVDK